MMQVQEIYFQPVSFTMMAFSNKSTLIIHELLVYDDCAVVWLDEGVTMVEGKLAGPVQHAFWNEEEQTWRVAGWREELRLSTNGVERTSMPEIPVHILSVEQRVMMLLNNGEWIDSAL